MVLKYAGQDATQTYNAVHPPSLIQKTLPPSDLKGQVHPSSVALPVPDDRSPVKSCNDEVSPPLGSILSIRDFENAAKGMLKPKAYAYYSSAATDLVSFNANRKFWDHLWFRPRLLRNVADVDTTCNVQGVKSSVPFLVAPAAMAKLAHPEGEMAIAKACKRRGVIQCVSSRVFKRMTRQGD